MREVKFGCPGFILRDLLCDDFAGTIKRVSETGFDGIELIGFWGRSAEEIRDACERAGIAPFGCFAQLPDLICEEMRIPDDDPRSLARSMIAPGGTPEEKLAFIRDIGCGHISLGIAADQTAAGFADQVERLLPYAERCGLKLMYHNHDREYAASPTGGTLMDELLCRCPEEMLFEPDLGWMGIAGTDAIRGMEGYASRIEVVHMKDYYRKGPDRLDASVPFEFRPTGYGVMDWAAVLDYCEEKVKPSWYVLDHDNSYDRDIFEELALSLEYLKKQLEYCGA